MTFAAELNRESICPIFILQIEGIGYAWSNVPLPSWWDAGGGTVVDVHGEVWTWQDTLLLDQVETVIRSDPWAGIPEAGDCKVSVRLRGNCATPEDIAADPMLAIISASIYRGATAVQTATCTAVEAAVFEVDATAGFAGEGYLYVGPETIYYDGLNATQFLGLTRGLWRSTRMHHEAGVGWTSLTGDGGAYVHDSPLSLSGRYMHLYVVLGQFDAAGAWVPGDRGLDGWYGTSFVREIFHGKICGWTLADDALSVEIEARDLLEILDQPIYRNPPSALAGHSGRNVISWDPSLFIEWGWDVANSIMGPYHWRSGMIPLVDYNLVGYAQYVATVATTFAAIDATMTQAAYTPYDPCGGTVRYHFNYDHEIRDGRIFVVFVATATSQPGADAFLRLYPRGAVGGEESILAEMGFTGEEEAVNWVAVGQSARWSIRATRGLPILRIPSMRGGAAGGANRFVPYSVDSQPGFVTSIEAESCAVLLDGAVFPCAPGGWQWVGETTIPGMWIQGPAFETHHDEELYVEFSRPQGGDMGESRIDDEERRRIRQVLAWREIPLPIALYYLLQAGEYSGAGLADTYWWGAGVGCDFSRFDEASLVEAAYSGDTRRDIVITEQTTIRELLASDLVQCGLWFGPYCDDATAAMQLTMRKIVPHVESESAQLVTTTLGHGEIDSKAGLKWAIDETAIVNVVRAENIGYNPGTGESMEAINHRNGTSTATWGATPQVTIDMRNTLGSEMARGRLVSLAQYLYSEWSTPYARFEIPLTRAKHAWTLHPLDTVWLTHDVLPNVATVAWGVAALPCRVVEVRAVWRAGSDGPRGSIVAVSSGASGWRTSTFAPCVRISDVHNAGTHLDCVEFYYGYDQEWEDDSWLQPGYKIRIYRPGNEAAAETTTVVSVDSPTHVTINPAIAQTGELVAEFQAYNVGGGLAAVQYKFTYMSAGTRQLSKGGGVTVAPFSYL